MNVSLTPELERFVQEKVHSGRYTSNLGAADRVIEALFAAFERLAVMPGLGHSREDLTDQPLRFWTVGAYLIIYRAKCTPIEIVPVTRGGRNIPRLLRRR